MPRLLVCPLLYGTNRIGMSSLHREFVGKVPHGLGGVRPEGERRAVRDLHGERAKRSARLRCPPPGVRTQAALETVTAQATVESVSAACVRGVQAVDVMASSARTAAAPPPAGSNGAWQGQFPQHERVVREAAERLP